MRRTDKEITNMREIDTILSKATVCRIGLVDNNVAYIVPLNFGYKNNCLYFHSAPIGKKIELITKNTMVCFEVDIDHDIVNTGIPCNWSNIIIDHYSPGKSYDFPEKNIYQTAIIIIEISQMTGKKSR